MVVVFRIGGKMVVFRPGARFWNLHANLGPSTIFLTNNETVKSIIRSIDEICYQQIGSQAWNQHKKNSWPDSKREIDPNRAWLGLTVMYPR